MADTHRPQPSHDPIFSRLEQKIEDWRDELAQIEPHLSSGEKNRLTRRWEILRQNFNIAALHKTGRSPLLDSALDPLPSLKELSQAELDMLYEALQTVSKNLGGMSGETRGRSALLEEILHTDKPQKMRKSLEKMRDLHEGLQTRLLGLDAYIDLFQLAELPEQDLRESAENFMREAETLRRLTQENHHLDQQIAEMRKWLTQAEKSLTRQTPEAPPSPGAMQEVRLALKANDEVDQALATLFTNHGRLKSAKAYIASFQASKEETE